MRKRKSFSKSGKLLCLMLAVVLTLGAMPVYGTFASAGTDDPTAETASEMPAPSVEPDTPEPAAAPSPQGEPEATPTPGAEVTPSGEPEASPAPGETPTESPEPENTTYANSISGVLWIDANEDGTYDAGEQSLADYPLYLYLEGDTDNAVQTTTTDADGKYLFEDISPGRYVVGIKAEENGTEYLLPLCGVQLDNKFYFAPDWSKVISNAVDITADTVVVDISAAMRTMPQIQPMAGPYVQEINVGTTLPVTISTSGTYRLYGTNMVGGNAAYITVNTGVTATFDLDGVSISCTTSPFRLNGTANVTLVLMDGKTNTFKCDSTLSTVGRMQSGICVPPNASLTIKGETAGTGILNATGGYYSAGIGGYYATSTAANFAQNAAGTITIESGIVNATGSYYGAGIGGGYCGAGGTINIYGGTVTADIIASNTTGGAGIGGGANGAGGTITISGGVVKATGSRGAGEAYSGTGIGAGGNATAGTNIFTGGSIEARNGYEPNAIETRAATTTTNGSVNGTQQVYCIAVKVVQGDGITPIAGAEVRIPDNVTSGYLYTATTDSTGIAYCWVPAATAKMIEAEHEDYGAGQTDPDPDILANNTNTTTIILGMRITLSRTPNTIAFISATNPTPVTLNVKAENMISPAGLKEIVDLEWFRVSTTDTTVYNSGSFATGYSAATSGNSGTDADMSVDDPTSNDERNYEMPVSENGKYWVRVHYKDKNGVDRYQVKSIVIDNVYTPSTLTYKGVNVSDSSEIVFPSTDYTGAGVAYQLDSATIIYSTADGTTAVSGTGAQITLTAPVHTPYWITPSPASYTVDVDGVALGEKVFTYAKDPAWWVTITYAAIMDTGGSVSIVSNTNPTSVKLNVSRTNVEPNVNAAALNIELVGYRDSNSATPTAVIPITTAFTPSANTTITFVYRNSGFTVTEKYVDQSGNPIPHSSGAGDVADTSQFVNAGNNYSGTPAPSGMPSGYICIGYKIGSATDTFATATAGTSGNTNPTISSVAAEHTVWYIYAQEIGSIKIEKYAHDGTTLLPGAEFQLEKLTGPSGTIDTTFTAQTLATGAGGNVTFVNLPVGSYRITETKAPAGYELLTAAFEVDIPKDITYAVGTPPADNSYLYSTTSGSNVIYHYYDVTYKVSDQASIAMPAAGATGNFPPYALWGSGLILLATLCGGILWTKRRRAYAPKHG